MALIKTDCRFFKGSRPCKYNKTRGCECPQCEQYAPYSNRILVIKLDSLGDVLRTTCILPKIKEYDPSSYIVWITRPESVHLVSSNEHVDETWAYDLETLSRLHTAEWHAVYSLSNDHPSSALASLARTREKTGFLLTEEGIIAPTNEAASRWLNLAVFDRIKKENSSSYQELMYDICGFRAPIERPCLSIEGPLTRWAEGLLQSCFPQSRAGRPILGINTGSGHRWPKKMLTPERLTELIRTLLKRDTDWNILLLGGPAEGERNQRISKAVDSERVGNPGSNHSLLEFSAIINECDVLLCGDTLALHIASALSVPSVVLFGPTSSSEIFGYDGLIEKISWDALDCLCCYGDCSKQDDCMSLIPIEEIVNRIEKLRGTNPRAKGVSGPSGQPPRTQSP